jgi:hypothetical protein
LWFGASWDWRDQYLEINLGHLYWFKDVMPRVIILGNYSSYHGEVSKHPTKSLDDLEAIIQIVENTIDNSIEKYGMYYESILSKHLQPEKSKYAKDFILHLGNEVSKDELSKYVKKSFWF